MIDTSLYDHGAIDEFNEFDLDVTLSPLNHLEMTSLSIWQRQQVDGLPAEGQRCLFDSWFNTDQPPGENSDYV